jgi:predicted RNA-binding protein (virulence factor B family)
MTELGKISDLQVLKKAPQGLYLDGENLGEILLPNRYVPDGCEIGHSLEVFIYRDSSDLLIATTEKPKVMVGECAHLKVSQINKIGAFLDWGLMKDLLVPFSEQSKPMEEGKYYVAYVYIDNSDRIVASTKLSNFLSEESVYFKPKQAVNLLICGRSDLGYKAVINGTNLGLIFKDEVIRPLRLGQVLKGFIKNIREDRRIDLCLQFTGQEARDELSDIILQDLKSSDGVSTLTDKSDPKEIFARYKVSKNNYKRALGALYKQKLIMIEADKISLLQTDSP